MVSGGLRFNWTCSEKDCKGSSIMAYTLTVYASVASPDQPRLLSGCKCGDRVKLSTSRVGLLVAEIAIITEKAKKGNNHISRLTYFLFSLVFVTFTYANFRHQILSQHI